MASPDTPNFAERLRTLSNDDFVAELKDVARVCAGDDMDAMTFDLIEDRPQLTPEEFGTIEEQLEDDDLPPIVTTEDWEQYGAARRELVRRAVGYLGLTKEELFEEQ